MQKKALCAASIVAIASAVFSLRVLAAPISFDVPLSSAAEVPPEVSQPNGVAKLTWDPASKVVTWEITATGPGRQQWLTFIGLRREKMAPLRLGSQRRAILLFFRSKASGP
jgi:hypothetical protein